MITFKNQSNKESRPCMVCSSWQIECCGLEWSLKQRYTVLTWKRGVWMYCRKPDPGRHWNGKKSMLRIRSFFDPWIQDWELGSGMEKNPDPDSGSEIRNEHPGSYFRELETMFWVKNT